MKHLFDLLTRVSQRPDNGKRPLQPLAVAQLRLLLNVGPDPCI